MIASGRPKERQQKKEREGGLAGGLGVAKEKRETMTRDGGTTKPSVLAPGKQKCALGRETTGERAGGREREKKRQRVGRSAATERENDRETTRDREPGQVGTCLSIPSIPFSRETENEWRERTVRRAAGSFSDRERQRGREAGVDSPLHSPHPLHCPSIADPFSSPCLHRGSMPIHRGSILSTVPSSRVHADPSPLHSFFPREGRERTRMFFF